MGSILAQQIETETPGDPLTPIFHGGAVRSAVQRAEAALSDVLQLAILDKESAKDAALIALQGLEGVEGCQARELREKLSRTWHALRQGRLPEASAGPLGPVDITCTRCGEPVVADLAHSPRRLCARCEIFELGRMRPTKPEEKTMPEGVAVPEKAPEAKVCKKCGQTKPLDGFDKVPQNRDGHDGTCHECRAEMGRLSYARRKAAQQGRPAKAAPPEVKPAPPPEDTCNVVQPAKPEAEERVELTERGRQAVEDAGGHSFTEAADPAEPERPNGHPKTIHLPLQVVAVRVPVDVTPGWVLPLAVAGASSLLIGIGLALTGRASHAQRMAERWRP